MGSLDHTDIVRAIPDGQKDRLLVFLHEFNNERLLQRRDATWLAALEWMRGKKGNGEILQQMTALHMIASSRKGFEISFSSANPKLFPSMEWMRTHVSIREKLPHL